MARHFPERRGPEPPTRASPARLKALGAAGRAGEGGSKGGGLGSPCTGLSKRLLEAQPMSLPLISITQ